MVWVKFSLEIYAGLVFLVDNKKLSPGLAIYLIEGSLKNLPPPAAVEGFENTAAGSRCVFKTAFPAS